MSDIGISSGREKSIRADASDNGAFGQFFAVTDTWAGTTSKGRRFAVRENAAVIGVAAASY